MGQKATRCGPELMVCHPHWIPGLWSIALSCCASSWHPAQSWFDCSLALPSAYLNVTTFHFLIHALSRSHLFPSSFHKCHLSHTWPEEHVWSAVPSRCSVTWCLGHGSHICLNHSPPWLSPCVHSQNEGKQDAKGGCPLPRMGAHTQIPFQTSWT